MKGFNIGLVEGIEQSMHFGNKKSKNPLLNIVLKVDRLVDLSIQSHMHTQ